MADWTQLTQQETPGRQPDWKPIWEGDLCLITINLGFHVIRKPLPNNFVKRPYHRIIELGPRVWVVDGAHPMFGGVLTMGYKVTIHFQPTLKYARKNYFRGPDLHRYIMENYQVTVENAVHRELNKITPEIFLSQDIHQPAQRIATAVNQELIVQEVRCDAECLLSPQPVAAPTEGDDRLVLYPDFYHEVKQQKQDFWMSMTEMDHTFSKRTLERLESHNAEMQPIKVRIDGQEREALEVTAGRTHFERELRTADEENKADHDKRLATLDESVQLSLEEYRIETKNQHIAYERAQSQVLDERLKTQKLEEQLKGVPADEAHRLELLRIHEVSERTRAEQRLAFERQEGFLEKLPELIDKAAQHPPTIEHLRILQTGPATGGDGIQVGLGSSAWQLGQALTYFREIMRFLEDKP